MWELVVERNNFQESYWKEEKLYTFHCIIEFG